MPRHDQNQQISGGFTFLELLVALAISAILVTSMVGLFKALITTTILSLRQISVLSDSRKAVRGDGPLRGLITATQEGSSVIALSTGSLTLFLPSIATVTYSISGTTLYQSQPTKTYVQAKEIATMKLDYYKLDDTGRIAVSTTAEQALFVTTSLSLMGRRTSNTTYYFYSAAFLRNK